MVLSLGKGWEWKHKLQLRRQIAYGLLLYHASIYELWHGSLVNTQQVSTKVCSDIDSIYNMIHIDL